MTVMLLFIDIEPLFEGILICNTESKANLRGVLLSNR